MTSSVDVAADFLVHRHTRRTLALDATDPVPDQFTFGQAYLIAVRIDRYLGHSYSVADHIELLDPDQPVALTDLVTHTTTAMAPGPHRRGMT